MSKEHLRGVTHGAPHADVDVTNESGGTALGRPHLSLVTDESDAFAALDAVEDQPTTNEQWQERALCAQTDPEAFFPEKGGSTREAKKICQRCPVRRTGRVSRRLA